MELRIEIRGIEEQVSLIEEELRELRRFEDYFQNYEVLGKIDPVKSKEERERMQRLRESVEARRYFVENLREEYRRLDQQLRDILNI